MGRWSDLDRPPLQAANLLRGLVRGDLGDGRLRVRVVQRTGSTNADLREAALAGAAEGEILVAEEQTAGRGRHGRSWVAPPTAALTFSIVLRPAVPAAAWGWVPLLTGVAVATALSRLGEVDAAVKWPNDIVAGGRKLGGILVERVESPAGSALPPAAVVGIGLNVSQSAPELPVPTATSLLLEGSTCVDRLPIFRAVVRELLAVYDAWIAAGGDASASGLAEEYAGASATLGRQVQLDLPGGRRVVGMAAAVDDSGALVVDTAEGREVLSAGEVTHLRPAQHTESDSRSDSAGGEA